MSTSVMATVLVTFHAQAVPLTGGGGGATYMEALEGREVGCCEVGCMLGVMVSIGGGGLIRAW